MNSVHLCVGPSVHVFPSIPSHIFVTCNGWKDTLSTSKLCRNWLPPSDILITVVMLEDSSVCGGLSQSQQEGKEGHNNKSDLCCRDTSLVASRKSDREIMKEKHMADCISQASAFLGVFLTQTCFRVANGQSIPGITVWFQNINQTFCFVTRFMCNHRGQSQSASYLSLFVSVCTVFHWSMFWVMITTIFSLSPLA